MSVSVLNTDSGLSGKTLVNAEDTQTLTGAKTFDRDPSAPFAVTSGSAVVTNLDADKLDGQDGSYYTNATNIASGTLAAARQGVNLPVSLTAVGSQNDLAITLTGPYTVARLNNATLLTITGIAAGTDGQILKLISVGAGQVDLAHQNAGSTVANRLINLATSGNTSLSAGVGTATYVYDGTTVRWRLIEHEQGAWITPTFAAGSFTASAGNFTVASGDVTTCAFYLRGRHLTVAFTLVTTTVSTTPNELRIAAAAWGSFTPTKAMWSVGDARDTGGSSFGPEKCTIDVAASGTYIRLRRGNWSGVNWVVATDTTDVNGEIAFEVT